MIQKWKKNHFSRSLISLLWSSFSLRSCAIRSSRSVIRFFKKSFSTLRWELSVEAHDNTGESGRRRESGPNCVSWSMANFRLAGLLLFTEDTFSRSQNVKQVSVDFVTQKIEIDFTHDCFGKLTEGFLTRADALLT